MGQAYQEQPEDVFNPVNNPGDWLEIVTSESSPGETSLSRDSQEASLVGYIPWNKQRSAAVYFLGFAQANSNGTLSRSNPEAHPVFPWLYASDVSFKPYVPVANPNFPGGYPQLVSPFSSPEITLNIATHVKSICNVKFKSYRYSFFDDSYITDPRMEWYRNVYLDLEPKVEVLSADGVSYLAFVETSAEVVGPPNIPAGPTMASAGPPPVNQTAFPAPLCVLLGKNIFTLNWLDVPFEYLSTATDFFYPTNILDCLGCVNSQTFPYNSSTPFPIGTLLMQGVKFTQKVFPVAPAFPQRPLISVDVSIILEYFDPPKGNPFSSYQGHNLMPWKQNGLFYYATRVNPRLGQATVNTPPLLPQTDFNQIFVNPNA